MSATLLSQTGKITRQELQTIPVPHGTSTHQPLSHFEIVEALLETLGVRRIEVVRAAARRCARDRARLCWPTPGRPPADRAAPRWRRRAAPDPRRFQLRSSPIRALLSKTAPDPMGYPGRGSAEKSRGVNDAI